MHWKYLGGALKTIKNLSMDRWTLFTLNGQHLVYVAEGAGISNRKMEDIVTFQPGLTKRRDTVTLFNLLKRDQDHVFSKFSCFKAQISNPCISIGSICRVTSTTSKLRFCAGAFSLMSLKELRTEHLLLKIVCDDN